METEINGIKAIFFIPIFYAIIIAGIFLTIICSFLGFFGGFLPITICQRCSDKGVSY